MTDLTRMRCDGVNPQGYGGYNSHRGTSSFVIVVPFQEAIYHPPTCALHKRPYLTDGAYMLAQLVARFQESGEITDQCRVGYGTEQFAYCSPHGWSGSSSETTADDQCPQWRLAAWIMRRHEYGAQLAVGS